jgi:hypothetical protein
MTGLDATASPLDAPVVGETLSQLAVPAPTACVSMLQFIEPEPVFKTLNVCSGGAAPPCVAENARPPCVKRIAWVRPLTTTSTRTVTASPVVLSAIRISPVHVPGGSPAGFTPIPITPGSFDVADPAADVSDSHCPHAFVWDVAV